MKQSDKEMNEISEGKLARLALVGAIVLGVASGNAAQVSNREINNWKRDFNSLTIKDKKKVLGMIDEGRNPVAKNINRFNKPKTFTDRKKRDKRGYEKHKGKKLIMGQKEIEEKLSPSHGIKAYIDDFQKSDAPQFQGKSAEKRRDMAIAAYLSAKRGTNEEVEQVDEDYSKKSTASLQKTHDKWKDRPMSPASANQLKMIRRELQKRGAMQKEEVEQVDEVSKDMKQRYLDKAVPSHYRKFTGREPTTKQQLDKRRATIQKVSQELKGRKHFSDFGEEVELDEESKGLAAKAKKSGISVGTLRKVYNRGVAAWKTGHRPGTTPQQWGHARVNAFIVKKKKGGLNHDKDLA